MLTKAFAIDKVLDRMGENVPTEHSGYLWGWRSFEVHLEKQFLSSCVDLCLEMVIFRDFLF